MGVKQRLEHVDADLRDLETTLAAAETSKDTFLALEDSAAQVEKLLRSPQPGAGQERSVAQTAELAAVVALMASLTKSMEATRKAESERLLRGVEQVSEAVRARSREARSHGHLQRALTYLPVPNAERLASPLARMVGLGAAAMSMADDGVLDPAVTAILNLSVHGKHAHHLGGRVKHQATLDWLEKAAAVQIGEVAQDFQHSCLFVSLSKACDAARHAELERRAQRAHEEDAPLQAFLGVASLPLHGSHPGREDDPMHARTHLCYDVAAAWRWLVDKGLRVPPQGLVHLAHGTVGELQAAFPKALPNPARHASQVCPGRPKAGFEASREPSTLPWRDVETLLRAVVAHLYLEVLETLAAGSFADCGGELRALERSLGRAAGQEQRYRAVFERLLAPEQEGASPQRRVALLLYYLYGPAAACASFDSLYPHGEALRELLRDLSAVREKLQPVAAQAHHRAALLSLAQTGLTHLGRTAVGRALHAVKRRAKTAARAVVDASMKLLDLQYYLSFLQPVFCLLAFVGLFFSKGGGGQVQQFVAQYGLSGTVVHLLFGKLAAKAFSSLHQVYNALASLKATDKAVYLFNVLVRQLLAFFEEALPNSKKLWEEAFYAHNESVWTGWLSSVAGHVPLVGAFASSALASVKDWYGAQALVNGVLACGLMPLEAFVHFGAKVAACVHYVAPGGAIGGLGRRAPFFLSVLEILTMIQLGNAAYVFLRILEFVCREFHAEKTSEEVAEVCTDRARKYRHALMLLRAGNLVWSLFTGAWIAGLASALTTLMDRGVETGFMTYCLGEVEQPDLQRTLGEQRQDLNLPPQQRAALSDEERAFEQFFKEHNAHVRATLSEGDEKWKALRRQWATTFSGVQPPGNEKLAQESEARLDAARDNAERARAEMKRLAERHGGELGQQVRGQLRTRAEQAAEENRLDAQISKVAEMSLTGKAIASNALQTIASDEKEAKLYRRLADECRARHPNWTDPAAWAAWVECKKKASQAAYPSA